MLLMKKYGNRRGGVLVVVAVTLIVLFAMAALSIDLGRLYAGRQRARDVCDAAALAGARFLDPNKVAESLTPVTNSANEVVIANNLVSGYKVLRPGTETEGVVVSFPDSKTVRVDGEVNVDFAFAGIMGFATKGVSSHSVVKLTTAERMKYPFAPLCIGEVQFAGLEFGELQALKTDKWQDGLDVFIGPGNFGCLAFGGESGAAAYRDRLSGATASPVNLACGDFVDTEPGNMTGPTYDGAVARVASDTVFTNDTTAWAQWSATWNPTTMGFASTPRLIVLPVVRVPEGGMHGRTSLEVVGFAGFFLEHALSKKETSWDGEPCESVQVMGRFVAGAVGSNAMRWLWWMGSDSTVSKVLDAELID